MTKGSFNAPDVCVDCKVDTPHKYHSCSSPCDKYKQESARRAEATFNVSARSSIASIKRLHDQAEHLRTD